MVMGGAASARELLAAFSAHKSPSSGAEHDCPIIDFIFERPYLKSSGGGRVEMVWSLSELFRIDEEAAEKYIL